MDWGSGEGMGWMDGEWMDGSVRHGAVLGICTVRLGSVSVRCGKRSVLLKRPCSGPYTLKPLKPSPKL